MNDDRNRALNCPFGNIHYSLPFAKLTLSPLLRNSAPVTTNLSVLVTPELITTSLAAYDQTVTLACLIMLPDSNIIT